MDADATESSSRLEQVGERALADPDSLLMLRVQQDDHAAFEDLVQRYQHRVLGILHHMIGGGDEVDDLAQEVFLRVFRSRKNYKPTAKFSTWLYTITNNLALNALRDRRRKPVVSVKGSESGVMGARPLERLAEAPSGAMPSRVFAKVEMAEIVRAAVAQLSDEQRMAVILNKFEEMDYRQIALVMNKSEMAIKSLLSRARASLREILAPYLAEGRRPEGAA